MKLNGISFLTFGWMLLLVVSKFVAAHNSIFNDILQSVRNIEKIVKSSTSDTSIYVSNIPNRIIQTKPHIHFRDINRESKSFNDDDYREILKLERLKLSNKDAINNYRRSNQQPKLLDDNDDDDNKIKSIGSILQHLVKLRKGRKIYDKSSSLDESSNENINTNSNDNRNVNSNVNKRGSKYHSKSEMKIKTGRNLYGGRSLSQSDVKDSNRNVNSNTNINTNSNINNSSEYDVSDYEN